MSDTQKQVRNIEATVAANSPVVRQQVQSTPAAINPDIAAALRRQAEAEQVERKSRLRGR